MRTMADSRKWSLTKSTKNVVRSARILYADISEHFVPSSLLENSYFQAKPFPIQIPQHFSNLVILHTYLPIKMEQCSETSAYKI